MLQDIFDKKCSRNFSEMIAKRLEDLHLMQVKPFLIKNFVTSLTLDQI